MRTTSQVAAILPPERAELDQSPAYPRNAAREIPSAEVLPISVVVPVRNDPTNLERCLRSLDASEHPAYEVISVDDASTDSTPEVARRHGARLIRQVTRSGPAAARNHGASAARQAHPFFVDADVCVDPGALGQVARLSAVLAGGLVAALALGSWFRDPIPIWSLGALGCLLGIVLFNLRFYLFRSRVKTPIFAGSVLPLHAVYYLSSGFAFASDLILHLGRRRRRPNPG